MAVIATAVISGLVALGGSMLSSSRKKKLISQQIRRAGRKAAGINRFQARQGRNLISSANAIERADIFGKLEIVQSQAVAEANARAGAAQAGVAGDSVDQVVAETEINAGKASTILTENTKAQIAQSKQNAVDGILEANTQKTPPITAQAGGLLDHALAFAGGFASGGGFSEIGKTPP